MKCEGIRSSGALSQPHGERCEAALATVRWRIMDVKGRVTSDLASISTCKVARDVKASWMYFIDVAEQRSNSPSEENVKKQQIRFKGLLSCKRIT